MPLGKRLASLLSFILILAGCSDTNRSFRPFPLLPSVPNTMLLVQSDGNLILRSLAGDETMTLTADAQGTVNRNAQFAAEGMRIVWQRDDRDFRREVWVMNRDGLEKVKLGDGSIAPAGAVFRDGRVVYSENVLATGVPIGSTIRVVDLGSRLLQTIPLATGTRAYEPQWSASGRRIAFLTGDGFPDGKRSIVLWDADSAVAFPIDTAGVGPIKSRRRGFIRWAPTGNRLAFVRYDDTGTVPSLFVLDVRAHDVVADSLAVVGVEGNDNDSSPEWSSDGSRLFFRGVDLNLHSIPAAGGPQENVSQAVAIRPRVASGGTQIAYTTDVGAVTVSGLDGSNKRIVLSARPGVTAFY